MTLVSSPLAGRVVAIAAGVGVLGGSVAYATGAVGAPASTSASPTSAIHLVDNDGDRPLFSLANMAPGTTASSCIAVTNDSPVPVDVALHTAPTGNLDGFLGVTTERGTADAPQPKSCAGFTRDGDVWSGALADLPRPGRPGIPDAALATGVTRVYRYTATLPGAAGNPVQGRRSTVSFAFSGTGEPPTPGPTATPTVVPTATPALQPPADVPILIDTKPGEVCATYHLQGGTVQRSVRIRGRVSAVLAIRKVGTGRKERLQLTTSLRNRQGKVLRIKGWANVTYTRNGKRFAKSKKRPFRVNVKPSSLRTGTNKLGVLIRDRHGKKTRASFRLVTSKALLQSQTVCVFRATARPR